MKVNEKERCEREKRNKGKTMGCLKKRAVRNQVMHKRSILA